MLTVSSITVTVNSVVLVNPVTFTCLLFTNKYVPTYAEVNVAELAVNVLPVPVA